MGGDDPTARFSILVVTPALNVTFCDQGTRVYPCRHDGSHTTEHRRQCHRGRQHTGATVSVPVAQLSIVIISPAEHVTCHSCCERTSVGLPRTDLSHARQDRGGCQRGRGHAPTPRRGGVPQPQLAVDVLPPAIHTTGRRQGTGVIRSSRDGGDAGEYSSSRRWWDV